MKVLLLYDSISFGGAENLLVTLAKAAPAVGFTFDVVCVGSLKPESAYLLPLIERAGVAVSHVSVKRFLDPPGFLRLVRAIRASNCDVVHAHLITACTLGPLAAALVGRPTVCTFHHYAAPLQGRDSLREWLGVQIASKSKALIFVSEAAHRAFERRYHSRRSWMTIPNGVDLDAFRPEPASMPAELAASDDEFVVTLVAAMRGPKGHDDALVAWETVFRRFPRARLLFVGAGAQESALRRRVVELGLETSVTFAGIRHDVARIMRASTLVILPSEIEALPTTVMEAAACGRAVVATAVGGTPEVVTDKRTGLLVPPREPERLARAIVHLLEDPAGRASMGRAARSLAEDRFDMRLWAARLKTLYERVAGSHP